MEERRRPIDRIAAAKAALEESKLNRFNGYRALERQRLKELSLAERLRARLARLSKHNKKRRPPESGMPAPVDPPKGPKPMQGGAAARLEFD